MPTQKQNDKQQVNSLSAAIKDESAKIVTVSKNLARNEKLENQEDDEGEGPEIIDIRGDDLIDKEDFYRRQL